MDMNNFCCLQGNPVAISSHLLPVTHNLVDPHGSSDLEKIIRWKYFSLLTVRCWQSIWVGTSAQCFLVFVTMLHPLVGNDTVSFICFSSWEKHYWTILWLFPLLDFSPLPTLGLCTQSTSWPGLAHTCGRAPCTPPACTRSVTKIDRRRGKLLTLHWGIVSVTQSHFISHFGGGWTVLVPGTATFIHSICRPIILPT